MQVTRAGEYAVIGLLYLAKQPAERTVMIDEISEAEGIPKSFLAKIFQSLAKTGFVSSHRVEGIFALQKCVSDEPECVVSNTRMSTCTLCAVFSEAQNRVNEVFTRTTLANLLQPKPHGAHLLKTPVAVN
jgi:DNA-binding IscR family transcriptional regulator